MRVGEALAAEVRHRVGLAPHDVVQDPEAEILQDRADAEDVVIGADHPERAVVLQHAPRCGQPGAGEAVIVGEAGELVPVVVDRVDLGIVRPAQFVLELKIVGRVGEDQVGAAIGQGAHALDAVALDHLIQLRNPPSARHVFINRGRTVIRRSPQVKSLAESKCYR